MIYFKSQKVLPGELSFQLQLLKNIGHSGKMVSGEEFIVSNSHPHMQLSQQTRTNDTVSINDKLQMKRKKSLIMRIMFCPQKSKHQTLNISEYHKNVRKDCDGK